MKEIDGLGRNVIEKQRDLKARQLLDIMVTLVGNDFYFLKDLFIDFGGRESEEEEEES